MEKGIKIINISVYFILFLATIIVVNHKVNFKKNSIYAKTSTNIITDQSNAEELSVEIYNWGYKPPIIKTKIGKLLKLNLKNISDADHTFTLEKFGFSTILLQPGQTTTVQFTPNEKGIFTFYCAIYCGDGHDQMSGKLEVYE